MYCPKCKSERLKVTDSAFSNSSCYRKLKCRKCNSIFFSKEIICSDDQEIIDTRRCLYMLRSSKK